MWSNKTINASRAAEVQKIKKKERCVEESADESQYQLINEIRREMTDESDEYEKSDDFTAWISKKHESRKKKEDEKERRIMRKEKR